MNKALLLASAACVLCFSTAANAQQMFGYEIEPYIGLDYVYSHADYKSEADVLKKDFNSGAVNIGTRLGKYAGLEAFYQQSGDRKTNVYYGDGTSEKLKTRLYSYGLDLYGYMPLDCFDKFDLVGSIGAANLNMRVKGLPEGKYDKNHMAWRAGAGLQYNFDEHVSARVMYRYSYVDTKYLDNLNEVTAGLRYTF